MVKSTRNPYKTMFKGTTNNSGNFHRPEGAGNFDNMDDYNIVKTINSKNVNVYPYTISNKITPAETNVIGFVNRVSGESANIGLGAIDGDGTDNVGIIIGGVADFDVFDNTETMTMEWDSGESEYSIRTEATGTGIVRNLNIYTGEHINQLYIATNGDVGIDTDEPVEKLQIRDGNILITDSTNDVDRIRIAGNSSYPFIEICQGGSSKIKINSFGESYFYGGVVKIGSSTNYINISTTGDQTFVGSAGLPFAEIHTHDNSTATSVATGTTYTKIDTWDNNGLSNNCTPNATNNKITITKTGKYLVNCSINGESGSNNVTFKFSAFLNAVEQDQIHMHRKFAASGDKGSGAMTGIIDVTSVPLDLDVRARHDNGGSVNFTGTYMNINVIQIGGT